MDAEIICDCGDRQSEHVDSEAQCRIPECGCKEFNDSADDICTYCGENKWMNREKHITEIAKFLQEKIAECQEIIKDLK